jgi:hypothetical protein
MTDSTRAQREAMFAADDAAREAEGAYVLRQVMKFCDMLEAHMIEMHPRSFRDALTRTSVLTPIRIERDVLANRTVVMGK